MGLVSHNRRNATFIGFLITLALCVGISSGQEKKWKHYIKGPGVTYVTSGENCAVFLGCPATIETTSSTAQGDFGFSTVVSGIPTVTAIHYSYQISRSSPAVSVASGSGSMTPNTSNIYVFTITFSETLIGNLAIGQTQEYHLDLSIELVPGGQTATDSCNFQVKKVSTPPPTNLVLDVLSVKKNTQANDVLYTVAQDAVLPIWVLSPEDHFRFRIQPHSGTVGVPAAQNSFTWTLKDGGGSELCDGTFVYSYQPPASWYTSPIDVDIQLTNLSASLPVGRYTMEFLGTEFTNGGTTYRYKGSWKFQVGAPWMDMTGEASTTLCFDQYSLQPVHLQFARQNISDWGESTPAGHLYEDDSFSFIHELDVQEYPAHYLDFGDNSLSFYKSGYTSGTMYYRMKGKAEYPGGTSETFTSPDYVKIRYYPYPDGLHVQANAQCAVSGLPYWIMVNLMNWNSFTQVILEESTDAGFSTVTKSVPVSSAWNRVVQEVSQSTTYYYRARVTNPCGQTFDSDNICSVTVHAQDTIPPSVTFTEIRALDFQSIRLTMSGSDCGTLKGFRIYRDLASGVTPAPEKLAGACTIGAGETSTTFIDSGLANGARYFYVVTSVDSAGNESTPSNERSAATYPDATPPTTVSGLALRYYSTGPELNSNASREVFFLNFNAATDPESAIAYYQVGLEDQTVGGEPIWRWTLNSAGKQWLSGAELTEGHVYRLQVRAVNTSFAVGAATATTTFSYVPNHHYTREESDFPNSDYLTNNIIEKEIDPAYQQVTYDSATHSIRVFPGSGEAAIRKKVFPAPQCAVETIVKTISSVDGDGWFEVRLEGPQGAYVVRAYYGYGSSAHYVAKYVNGTAVALTHFTTTIQQSRNYLITLQHSIVTNDSGITVSRLIVGGFDQDITLDDSTATNIDVYQVRYVACQQVIGVDYYAYEGYAVPNLGHDPTPPSLPVVFDNVDYLGLGGSSSKTVPLSVDWLSTDPQSAITQYQYAVGTSVGGTNVVPWTTVAPDPENLLQHVDLSITAQDRNTYYVSVKAKNDKGLWSAIGTSDGALADMYSDSGLFDPFEVSPQDNPTISYHNSTFGLTYQAATKVEHVENTNTSTPAYLAAKYERTPVDLGFTEGSFRISLDFHDAPGGNTNAHMLEFYLGQFITDPTDPGTTYYRIKLLSNVLTVEKYYQGTREVYQQYTATITKNTWGYLQFTFRPGKINIKGLGLNQTFTFSTTHGIPVHNFILRFQRVNMEIDNIGLCDKTFGNI